MDQITNVNHVTILVKSVLMDLKISDVRNVRLLTTDILIATQINVNVLIDSTTTVKVLCVSRVTDHA